MSKLLLPAGTKGASSVTKDMLETRLKKLEQEKLNIMTALASYDGAIQDCQHWIKELENGGQDSPK